MPSLARQHVHEAGEQCAACEEVRGIHHGEAAVARQHSWPAKTVARALEMLSGGGSYAEVARWALRSEAADVETVTRARKAAASEGTEPKPPTRKGAKPKPETDKAGRTIKRRPLRTNVKAPRVIVTTAGKPSDSPAHQSRRRTSGTSPPTGARRSAPSSGSPSRRSCANARWLSVRDSTSSSRQGNRWCVPRCCSSTTCPSTAAMTRASDGPAATRASVSWWPPKSHGTTQTSGTACTCRSHPLNCDWSGRSRSRTGLPGAWCSTSSGTRPTPWSRTQAPGSSPPCRPTTRTPCSCPACGTSPAPSAPHSRTSMQPTSSPSPARPSTPTSTPACACCACCAAASTPWPATPT